jgi:hypothetical protein
MTSARRTGFWGIAILSAAGLACPGFLCAQAPPGPLPQVQSQDAPPPAAKAQAPKPPVQPRTSILGAWKLDPDDSDDPRKKMQDARGGGSSGSNGGYGGGRRMGGGYPGGGYPGGGGSGGRRSGSPGESDEDRQRMQELFTPARSLTLAEAQKDAEVDAFDDQNRKRALFTDGRKLQKSKDSNYQEIAAHWEGTRLTTDEKNPRGGKMSRTFELGYDGTQLYETLHLTVGRDNTPLVIRYVYDQANGPAPSAAASSPAPPAKQ